MAPLTTASAVSAPSGILVGPNAGSGAGEVDSPRAVAVDQSDGTVYVGEHNNYRISEFDSAGHFLRAFGFGVRTGVAELQACTTFCEPGLSGSAPGEMTPLSLAVDNSGGPSAHDVYVFDEEKYRVEKYTPSGEFLLMFGREVDKTKVAQAGSSEVEQNLCTEADLQAGDTCGDGSPDTGPGAFGLTSEEYDGFQYHPVTVDASGAVWVGEPERLEQFSPAGAFLSEIKLPGVGVVESLAMDASGDSYTITPGITEIQEFAVSPSGTFTLSFEGQTTAPLQLGTARAAEGKEAFKGTEEIRKALEGLSTIGENVGILSPKEGVFTVRFFGAALAGTNVPQMTISTGTSTTTRQGVPGRLDEFNPSGELLKVLDAVGHPNAMALDPATGNLFVSDQIQDGTATLLQYDSSGAQIEAFGAGEVLGAPHDNALAFGDTAGRLYVVSGAVQAFALPAPGPLVEHATTKATNVRKTAATLTVEVDPEGRETTFHFQYVDQKSFETEGGFSSPHTVTTSQSTSIGQDFAAHLVSFEIAPGQLKPATAYRFRVVATNENAPAGGTVGEEETFETEPAARVDSTSVAEVTADSATLQAEVNPLGDVTEYRFEYLTEAEFQADGESFSGPDQPVSVPQPDGSLGSGGEEVSVAQHLQGLSANAVYRYRLVAHNVAGTQAGPDRSFTAQAVSAGSALLDGRAWEMVSPADKHGALILGINEVDVVQAAARGDAMTYEASSPTEAEPQGSGNGNQLFSSRNSDGWVSRDLNVPHENATGVTLGGANEYRFFSGDLSLGVVQPFGAFVPSLSAEASEQTAFQRIDYVNGNVAEPCVGSCYRPLVTGAPGYANVPSETVFSPATCHATTCGPEFVSATRDLRHIVLESRVALEPGARPNALYEWTDGRLTYLPGMEAPSARHGISDDGSRIFANLKGSEGEKSLVVRDTVKGETAPLDAAEHVCLEKSECTSGGGTFQIASSDGSRVFFTDEHRLTSDATAASTMPDLYEYNFDAPEGERLTDLTVDSNLGERANVQGGVVGASEDGSWVYFVANGMLAQGAVKGACDALKPELPGVSCNLYAWHDGTTKLVAVLSGLDSPNWRALGGGLVHLGHLVARVSPNGEWLAFMSQRPLTGYDNRDASNGNADEEVYLYSAAGAGRTICASCDPTGARPVGTEYSKMLTPEGEELAGVHNAWNEHTWIAANIPGWSTNGLHQPRDLSDSGRLFFNSDDSLVAQDINGKEDVYEYEPPGVGGCSTESMAFSERSEGCVGLVSSGSSAQESGFLDASESGGDVFFVTTAKLAVQDYDKAFDVYDAHECRISSPCFSSPVAPPACTTAEGCRSAPVPQPVIFGAPSSATFSGAGNVFAPGPVAIKPRSITRAQKLARALQACRLKPSKKRLACRRRAKQAYSSRHKANGGR